MKTLNYIVLVLSIIFVLLFTSIEIVSVLKPLYEGQYKSNKVYDVAYVKDYPVAQVTDDIILYLADIINEDTQPKDEMSELAEAGKKRIEECKG